MVSFNYRGLFTVYAQDLHKVGDIVDASASIHPVVLGVSIVFANLLESEMIWRIVRFFCDRSLSPRYERESSS